jgi:hypothetical protein
MMLRFRLLRLSARTTGSCRRTGFEWQSRKREWIFDLLPQDQGYLQAKREGLGVPP